MVRSAFRWANVAVIAGLSALETECAPSWPSQSSARVSIEIAKPAIKSMDRALIEAQPVCIVSSVWSAGELGSTLVYHYRRYDNRVDVGYFAFWSTERPWGFNALTLSVLPAAAIDAVYSHFLFVLPGLRALIYGPGDIEGATITYELTGNDTLSVVGGVAQNGFHDEVALTREDMLDDSGRVILMSDVWSHQLGAKQAVKHTLLAGLTPRCFSKFGLARLDAPIVDEFRLGSPDLPRRARAAWRPFSHPNVQASRSAPSIAQAGLKAYPEWH